MDSYAVLLMRKFVWHGMLMCDVCVELSSVQDGICALRKAYIYIYNICAPPHLSEVDKLEDKKQQNYDGS